MNIKSVSICLISVICVLSAFAQSDVPAPAPAQSQSIYLTHATIHTGDGKVLHDATIGFDKGKIIFLAESPSFKTDETMGKVIDCTGKQIYPGIIAPYTKAGIDEIEAVRATNDYSETGSYNPDVRAIVAYNTDSRVTPTLRSNGILFAQTVPLGGVLSGTSALVQLDAWNWEDALVKEDGIWLNWPSMVSGGGWWGNPRPFQENKNYSKQADAIREYFREAKSYAEEASHTKTNLRFEAMKPLFNQTATLYIAAGGAKEMQHAIAFAEELGLRIVLAGAHDSYQIAEELARKKIPVILDNPHSLPTFPEEDVNQPYKTPGELQKAGVLFCLSIPGRFWEERNLMFEAGTAVAWGLSKEEALATITSNAAKILGVDDKIGTLEKGKSASLIISSGDVLDMKSSVIEHAFIDGREINLDNKQKELDRKFEKKYGLN